MSTSYPLPENEEDRLKALAEYHIVDTPPEDDFVRLADLASRLFNVPIVLVSLIERERQFFKAHVGVDICETGREVSFCAHAIVQDDIFVVPDALLDERFSSNALVLGPPFIRFYAGKPLVAPGGEKIGTLCLIDTKPIAEFTEEDHRNLSDIAALVMDRMESRRLDYVRSISQARFENIAATSPDAIICSDSEGRVTFWNPSAERLFGYTSQEILGLPCDMIIPRSWRRIYDEELARLKKGQKLELADQTVELSGLHKDGSEFPAEISLSTWQEGDSASVGAIVRDISERKQNEERLFRLASIDALTDLPNRSAWRACLDKTIADERPATILLFDLDGFKDVNDILGHSAGDAILKEVAARFKKICSRAIKVARLGGDEFVALLPGNSERQAKNISARLVSAISAPYEFAGQHCEIGVSVGVSLAPQHGIRPEELLGAADLALYRVKATGKGRFELFEPALRDVAIARRAFEAELKLAFENGEFEMFYQPQFSTETGQLSGAEALMRWNHPTRGLLTPASFMEVLSQKPSAAAVGEWVVRTVCRQLAAWRVDVPEMKAGLNLFEAQFHSGRLLSTVRKILDENNLDPAALELEILETILLRNDAVILKLLKDLRSLGVGLAFDDYGTGYASLGLLKSYPVSRLKIDQSFIRDVHVDSENAAVVKAILYLGRSFGMSVIAEGVETESQLNFLRKHNCDEVQGYYFSRPVSAQQFTETFITPLKR